jgi:hypothetical protein
MILDKTWNMGSTKTGGFVLGAGPSYAYYPCLDIWIPDFGHNCDLDNFMTRISASKQSKLILIGLALYRYTI